MCVKRLCCARCLSHHSHRLECFDFTKIFFVCSETRGRNVLMVLMLSRVNILVIAYSHSPQIRQLTLHLRPFCKPFSGSHTAIASQPQCESCHRQGARQGRTTDSKSAPIPSSTGKSSSIILQATSGRDHHRLDLRATMRRLLGLGSQVGLQKALRMLTKMV